MTNYSVMVKKDPRGYRPVKYDVSREGNQITLKDTSAEGFRHMGDNYQITLQDDSVQIRSMDKNYDINMGPEGVTVSDPRKAGRRGGMGDLPITGLFSDTPIQPEQYEQVGLSVASSLIGIPLFFPPGA